MRKLLLLCPIHSGTGAQVRDAVGREYAVIVRHREEDCISMLKRETDIATVLLDCPSRFPRIRIFLDYVKQHNSDLFSASVLLLTEADSMEADLAYLGGAVVDCMRKPLNATILLHRLEVAQRLMNSTSYEDLSAILTSLPSIIFLKDPDGRYVFASRPLHHLNVDTAEQVRGKTDLQVRRDRGNARLAQRADEEVLRTGRSKSYVIEERSGERTEYAQIIKAPVYFPDGRPRGVVGLVNDVTEMETLRRELRKVSITDQLTGLYNRSYLEEFTSNQLRNGTFPVCIIMADCDNLKYMNDTYGHLAGDRCILRCAQLFKRCLPHSATVFRMGGDEFMAFVPGMGDPQAKEAVGIISRAVSACKVCGEPLSISLGFSTMMNRTFSLKTCMTIADDKMYQDKQERKRARQPSVPDPRRS